MAMIIVNFTHPLTEEQQSQIEQISGQRVEKIFDSFVSMENENPFEDQIKSLIETVPLTPIDWQIKSILVNPPGLSSAALVLFAELHGRMGYFPSIIRIRPIKGGVVQMYEVGEILNLQNIRNKARKEKRINEEKI